MTSALSSAILSWDGRSVGELEAMYERFSAEPHFTTHLLTSLSDPNLQDGATWLLKHHLEQGVTLSDSDVAQLYGSLSHLTAWQAQLHVLQLLPHLPINKIQAARVEQFLRRCLTQKNKFVRAWAYGGFYSLAHQHPAYRDEVRTLFATAQENEAASVRARIRQVTKSPFGKRQCTTIRS